MCDAVHRQWYGKILSLDELFELFYANMDFCIEKNFPNAQKLREILTLDELRSHGCLADDDYSLLNPKYSVVMGKSNSTIRYNGRHVGVVYLRDNSRTEISIKGNAHIVAHLYGSATLHIKKESSIKPLIVLHSDNIRLHIEGQTTIKKEL